MWPEVHARDCRARKPEREGRCSRGYGDVRSSGATVAPRIARCAAEAQGPCLCSGDFVVDVAAVGGAAPPQQRASGGQNLALRRVDLAPDRASVRAVLFVGRAMPPHPRNGPTECLHLGCVCPSIFALQIDPMSTRHRPQIDLCGAPERARKLGYPHLVDLSAARSHVRNRSVHDTPRYIFVGGVLGECRRDSSLL